MNRTKLKLTRLKGFYFSTRENVFSPLFTVSQTKPCVWFSEHKSSLGPLGGNSGKARSDGELQRFGGAFNFLSSIVCCLFFFVAPPGPV